MGLVDVGIILLVFGFILGLSPAVISVLTSLLASSFGNGNSKIRLAGVALVCIETLFMFYFCFALVCAAVLNSFDRNSFDYIGIFLGLALVGFGIYGIALAYLKGNSKIRRHLSPLLHKHTVKRVSFGSVIKASVITAIMNFRVTLLPIAGATYILAFISNPKIGYLAILPLAMLLPISIIAIMALKMIKLSALMKWKNDNADTFQAWTGVVTVVLGWLIWLLINESVTLN